jgi:hypothetical protein
MVGLHSNAMQRLETATNQCRCGGVIANHANLCQVRSQALRGAKYAVGSRHKGSAAEISSFSLPAAVSRREIDFRLRPGGISPRLKSRLSNIILSYTLGLTNSSTRRRHSREKKLLDP